jgi:hypothetical protein
MTKKKKLVRVNNRIYKKKYNMMKILKFYMDLIQELIFQMIILKMMSLSKTLGSKCFNNKINKILG